MDEAMNKEIEEEDIERDQYLVFNVNNQEYGLQAMLIQEISAMFEIKEVPKAPPYIEGIMNLRGRLVSIINFRKRFGFDPKEHDEDTRIIYVEHKGFPVGIIADSVEEVIKIPEANKQELPDTAVTTLSDNYITEIGMLDKRMIILLDAEKVLDKAELVGIEEAEKEISSLPAETMGIEVNRE